MLRLLVISILFCTVVAAAPAFAQQGQQNLIYQTGPSPVTPLHPMMWAGDGLAMDGGTAKPGGPGQNINEIGVVGQGLVSCVSDNYNAVAHHELCFAALDTTTGHTGALIDFKAVGGAAPTSVNCNINGVFVPDCLTQSVSFPLLQNAGAFIGTHNFSGAVTPPTDVFVLGSQSVPNTTQNPMMAIQKWALDSVAGGTNSALYVSTHKEMTGVGTRTQAAFFEAQDDVGGVGSFLEGIRSHAFAIAGKLNASSYGAVTLAGEEAGATHVYLIGIESQVDNNSVNTTNFFSNGQYAGSFVSTSGGSKPPDCGFCVNPFLFQATGGFMTGFFVPRAADPTRPNVIDSAFRSDADTIHGLNLVNSHPSYSAIILPNAAPVRIKNAAFTADFNVMGVYGDNILRLGDDSTLAQVSVGAPGVTTSVLDGLLVLGAAANIQNTANLVSMTVTQGAFPSGCGGPSTNHLALVSLTTNGTCNTYVNLSADGTGLVGRLQIGSALTNGFNIEGLTTIAAGTGKRFLCIDGTTKRIYEGTGNSCN